MDSFVVIVIENIIRNRNVSRLLSKIAKFPCINICKTSEKQITLNSWRILLTGLWRTGQRTWIWLQTENWRPRAILAKLMRSNWLIVILSHVHFILTVILSFVVDVFSSYMKKITNLAAFFTVSFFRFFQLSVYAIVVLNKGLLISKLTICRSALWVATIF